MNDTKAARSRANFGRMVRQLAPVAPPCFDERSTWVSYCESAAADQRVQHVAGPLLFSKQGVSLRVIPIAEVPGGPPPMRPPLLVEAGREVRFNPEFDFCADCRIEWHRSMDRSGRANRVTCATS